jgi:hypothetical protein
MGNEVTVVTLLQQWEQRAMLECIIATVGTQVIVEQLQ